MPLWLGAHDVMELLDEEALIGGIRSGFHEWVTTLPAPQRFHSALAGIPQTTDLGDMLRFPDVNADHHRGGGNVLHPLILRDNLIRLHDNASWRSCGL